MRLLLVAVVIGLALGWPPASSAPDRTARPHEHGRARDGVRKANAALMRQYSWTSLTEVIDQGR